MIGRSAREDRGAGALERATIALDHDTLRRAPRRSTMPLYMDIHRLAGMTPAALAEAHVADVRAQSAHQVRYLKYWFNQAAGKVFCLVEAPSADAAVAVHREAHGLVPDEIIEVEAKVVEAFLGDAHDAPSGAAMSPHGSRSAIDTGFRTILFTDLVGSTSLTQRLGDAGAFELLRQHDDIVRAEIERWGGREIKHTGDGIMACFSLVASAVESAIATQRAFFRYNQESRPEATRQPLQVRIGLSAGEPVEHRADLFGASVQLAARACAHAAPEQILVSNVVAELCIGKPFAFVDQGLIPLKGFDAPVRLHAVRWQDHTKEGASA